MSAPLTPGFAPTTSLGVPPRSPCQWTKRTGKHGLPPPLPDATIWCSMIPANSQPSTANRPRVGIPWRTTDEEVKFKTTGLKGKTWDYIEAVERAGGQGIPITLKVEEQRSGLVSAFDAYVLPGSNADLSPALYNAARGEKTHDADPNREKTDFAILDHALPSGK